MKKIFDFLTQLSANNNREWFGAHRPLYEEAKARFEAVAEDMIARVARIEPEVAALPVKNTLYRIYRDTRFSADKTPYKTHFGTYINPRGKKSLHGGYYLHVQPSACCLSVGTYCLPSPVLREVRRSIVDNLEAFEAIMTEPRLAALHPVIGETRLKTLPAGFPRDFVRPDYLQPREYFLTCAVPDGFFLEKGWQDRACEIFRLMKPFLDFVNDVADDYI